MAVSCYTAELFAFRRLPTENSKNRHDSVTTDPRVLLDEDGYVREFSLQGYRKREFSVS